MFLGITAGVVGGPKRAKIGAGVFEVCGVGVNLSRVGAGLSGIGIGFVLSNSGAKIIILEKVKLLEWVDLLKLLVNFLKLSVASFWASFWATGPYRGTWQQDKAIL